MLNQLDLIPGEGTARSSLQHLAVIRSLAKTTVIVWRNQTPRVAFCATVNQSIGETKSLGFKLPFGEVKVGDCCECHIVKIDFLVMPIFDCSWRKI